MDRTSGMRALAIRLAVVVFALLAIWASFRSEVGFFERRAIAAPGDDAPDKDDQKPEAFTPVDYSRRSKLQRAERLLKEENFEEALPLLASFLSGGDSEDYFLQTSGGASLKQHVEQLVLGLSPRGREAWEAFYAAEARKLLADGLSSGSPDKLAETVRRFPFTSASLEASVLLARRELDRGQPLAALGYIDAVRRVPAAERFEPSVSLLSALAASRAGRAEQAANVLLEVRDRIKQNTVSIAGRDVPLPNRREDVADWLSRNFGPSRLTTPESADWAVDRGGASRNRLGDGGEPLARRRWRAATYADPTDLAEIQRVYRLQLARGKSDIPTASPITTSFLSADGKPVDAVLVRAMRHLVAVDFATGRLLWIAASSPQPDVETPVEHDSPSDQWSSSSLSRSPNSDSTQLVSQRLWNDVPYGSISADTQRVYAIEDLGLAREGFASGNGFMQGRGRGDGDELLVNRLVARSLAGSGKLEWQVGGDDSLREPQLAKAFFLGAPLPEGNVLYAIAEIKREIRLVALDAASGKLLWQQQLAPAARSVSLDMMRRTHGATPALAEGVLVCPTGAGAVVGVDVARRALKWGFYYGKPPDGQITPWGFQSMNDRFDDHRRERWTDATALVAGGRVLVTPVDGDEGRNIFCLDLATGAKLWQRSLARRDNLFLAGVRQDRVLVVGYDRVQAFKLSDGADIWTTGEFGQSTSGDRCLPTGRGYAGADAYFQPTSTGELLQINLTDGKIAARWSVGREALGNLICNRGELVSYGVSGLEALYQSDALRRRVDETLAQRKGDGWALARRGELELHAGARDAARASFRAAMSSTADATGSAAYGRQATRLLASTLLDDLDRDFASHRGALDEIDRLVGEGELRERFERAAAWGLQRVGDRREALARYLRMIDVGGSANEMFAADDHRRTRRDAWLRARLASLAHESTAEERSLVDAAIAERVAAAVNQGGVNALRDAVAYFGFHPAAAIARVRLADELLKRGETLSVEQLLVEQANSSDPPAAAAALAMLGKLYATLNRPVAGHACAARLERQFGGVTLLASATAAIEAVSPQSVAPKTGAQAAAEIVNEIRIKATLDSGAALISAPVASPLWPAGRVAIELGRREGGGSPRETLFRVPVLSSASAAGTTLGELVLDRNMHRVYGRDAFGRQTFETSMASGDPESDREISPSACSARVRGHLVLFSAGQRIVALSALESGGVKQAEAKGQPVSLPLWEQLLSVRDDEEDSPRYARRSTDKRGEDERPWGEIRYAGRENDQRQGVLGPLGGSTIAFQRGRELLCVEPLTGQLVWSIDNIQEGCDLFGDDELLFVAPMGGQEAIVLRATDGEFLGKRDVPSDLRRMTTIGRRVLVWGQHDGKLQVRLLDAWTGKTIWNRPVAIDSKAQLVGGDLAILEPNGRLALVEIESGQPRWQQSLQPEFDAAGNVQLHSLHVIPSTDQLMVVANRNMLVHWDRTRDGKVMAVNRQTPLLTGRVYAINRQTGALRWPLPAEIDNQGLVTSQPGELPLLVFARHIPQSAAGDRRPNFTAQIFALDKRTGLPVMHYDSLARHVYSRLDLDATSAYGSHWTANPAKHTVSLALPSQTITFRFTEQPSPPEPPVQLADREPNRDAAETAKAIGSFFKAFGREAADRGDQYRYPENEPDDE